MASHLKVLIHQNNIDGPVHKLDINVVISNIHLSKFSFANNIKLNMRDPRYPVIANLTPSYQHYLTNTILLTPSHYNRMYLQVANVISMTILAIITIMVDFTRMVYEDMLSLFKDGYVRTYDDEMAAGPLEGAMFDHGEFSLKDAAAGPPHA